MIRIFVSDVADTKRTYLKNGNIFSPLYAVGMNQHNGKS